MRILPTSTRTAAVVTGAALVLTACAATGAGSSSAPSDTGPSGAPHGYVEGAQELTEPQNSLVLADGQGAITLFDLVSETATALPDSGAGKLEELAGDGRLVYPVRADGPRVTVGVIDTGLWTVDHGDHFHYYRADRRVAGTLSGDGTPVIRAADGKTAILFPGSGELFVLTHDDLAADGIGAQPTATIVPHAGMLALPYADHILVTAPAAAGTAGTIQALDEAGHVVPGAGASCPEVSDAVPTRAGAVFACADGALLVTTADGALAFEKLSYPAGVAPAARTLDGRTGRPAVAGAAGSSGAWRLDTRRREWTFLASDQPLVAVSAVGDNDSLTVAVDAAGRIRVFGADGSERATSEPVLAASASDADARRHIRLVVDAQRAYVSGPLEGVVLEIDYRDGARIARTFDAIDPLFVEQVG